MIKAVTERFKVATHYTVDCREGGRTQSTKVLVDETLREDRYSNIWTTFNSSLARQYTATQRTTYMRNVPRQCDLIIG